MSKRTKSPAEQLFDQVLSSMRALVPTCRTCKQTMPGVKIAPIARAVGVTPPTVESFLKGNSVSQTSLSKFSQYTVAQETETPATDSATA